MKLKRTFLATAFFVSVVINIFVSTCSAQENAPTRELSKAFVGFRIGSNVWGDDERYAQLLDLLDKYPGATDEITFFTQETHAPIPDEELTRRCVLLKTRIAQAKARGYRSGINILCTIGQHAEDLPHSIGDAIPHAVSIDGQIAQGTLCSNTVPFKARIRKIYTDMAEADPDYIWIDDDVRVNHMLDSAGTGGVLCFCDECVKLMAEQFNEPGLTREALQARMGDPATLAKIRQFNSDSIDALFALIEETIHKSRPDIPIGFMTGERYDEGYDFARWAKTLSGSNGDKEVYWRPGGGFYEQSHMPSLFGKSHEIGRQVSLLPPSVTLVESEIENFPYQPLAKSANVTTLEAAAHIGAGCTGAAFNVVTGNSEPLDDYEHMIATIAKRRPFFDLAVKEMGRRPNVGVFPLWERTDGNYPDRTPVQGLTLGIAEAGVPVAYQYLPDDVDVLLLSRAFLNHQTKEYAEKLFEKGVYTDVDAINLANDPNSYALNDLTGMEYGGEIRVDGIEQLTDAKLNGKYAGRTRDMRQSFQRETMFKLHVTRPGVETLSRAVDYARDDLGETIVGVYENPRGGRVCVNGYFPWSNFHNSSKQAQLRAVMRWLSKDRLPAYVDSLARVNFWLRKPDESGKLVGMAINGNYDDAENVAFQIKTAADSIVVYDFDCKPTTIHAESSDGAYRRFVVPKIAAWEPILIVCEK